MLSTPLTDRGLNVKGVFLSLALLGHLAGGPAICEPARAAHPARERAGGVPERVAYGHLFRQVMFLDRKAGAPGGQPQAEDSLRTFLRRQAGLSEEQYRLLSGVADDCERAAAPVDERAKAIVAALKLRGVGARLGADERVRRESELRKLQAERDGLILRGRERLRRALGAWEFGRFDEFVMRGIAGHIAGDEGGAGRGSAYGYTQLWYDRAAFMAVGYSATDLDYVAQTYYDAYVEGYLYLSDGFVWAKGSDVSLAGHAATFTAAYVSPSSQYSFYSDHYVRARQEKVVAADCRGCTRYFDPYCFSCAKPVRPGRFAVARAGGGGARVDHNYIYLFTTRDALFTHGGVLPRAGESSFGEALFGAVEHGKIFADADGPLHGGQDAGAAPVPAGGVRPAPVSSHDPNTLETSVGPTSAVEAGVQTGLAPLAEDVARDGLYAVGEDLRFRLWVTSYASTPLLTWADGHCEMRPRLMKGAEALTYKEEVLRLNGSGERAPSDFTRALVLWPGVAHRLNDLDLKDWYGPLGAGRYRLTLTYRSDCGADSNTVEFEVGSGAGRRAGRRGPCPGNRRFPGRRAECVESTHADDGMHPSRDTPPVIFKQWPGSARDAGRWDALPGLGTESADPTELG